MARKWSVIALQPVCPGRKTRLWRDDAPTQKRERYSVLIETRKSLATALPICGTVSAKSSALPLPALYGIGTSEARPGEVLPPMSGFPWSRPHAFGLRDAFSDGRPIDLSDRRQTQPCQQIKPCAQQRRTVAQTARGIQLPGLAARSVRSLPRKVSAEDFPALASNRTERPAQC